MVHNEKQRFQLAVHTVDSGKDRRCVTKIYAILCTSGHSIDVDTKLLSTPLLANKTDEIPAITRATMTINLA
eukprot:14161014-Heterocapsa_arctica.AAC.1